MIFIISLLYAAIFRTRVPQITKWLYSGNKQINIKTIIYKNIFLNKSSDIIIVVHVAEEYRTEMLVYSPPVQICTPKTDMWLTVVEM